jgi:hypothetical protein
MPLVLNKPRYLLQTIKCSIIVFGLFTFGSITWAADYYVTAHPNEQQLGTNSQPWGDLQHAVSQLRAGDTLWLKPGNYVVKNNIELKHSGTTGQKITIRSLPGERDRTIISGAGFAIKQQSFITIEGLTIQQAFNGIYVEGSALSPTQDITLRNNRTVSTVQSGIAVWGVAWKQDPKNYLNLSKLLIEGNTVEQACIGNDEHATNGYNEAITIANGVSEFEISHNLITNGGNPKYGGEGIDLKEGVQNGKVHHNQIHSLHRRGIYLDAGGLLGYSPPFVKNMRIYNNQVHSIREAFDKQSNKRLFEGAGAMAIMTEGNGSVSDIQIFNNRLEHSDEDGILIYQHPKGSGKVSNIHIYRNYIANHRRTGILVDNPSATSIHIFNNHLENNNQNLMLLRGDVKRFPKSK